MARHKHKGNSASLVFVLCAALFFATTPLGAQTYPAKPMKLIVPYPPGAGTDFVGRLIGIQISTAMGQPVIVENRGGAAAVVGTDAVAKAPPDGYTLGLVTSTFTMTPSMQKVPYDPVRDFAPVILLAAVPNILLVHPSLPVITLQDLLRLARRRPGELTYGTSGTGSVPHLATELLRSMVVPGIDIIHVPYKGNAQAIIELLGGHISMHISSMPSAVPFLQNGKLRAIAVTSAQRSPAAPRVPTIAESGVPGYDFSSEWGLLFPARTPPDIVARLNREVEKILKLAEVRERLESQGAQVVGGSPDEYTSVIERNLAKWVKVVQVANIRAE
jgi:tripartite-type tricarboxylate transporter receptor subunit TctC